MAAVGGEAGGGGGGGGGGAAKMVPMHRLFAFADRLDAALMAVGSVAALAEGLAMPFLAFLVGGLVDAFGDPDRANVVHSVSKVAVRFVYLAIASGLAGFLQVSSWMVTGERQAARIRGMYLETILRQDISFFDMETSTGEVIERMSSDTALIQDAIGEKVGKFLQLVSTFLGGFIIAFARGWLLSLVMLTSIPPVVACAAVMALVLSKLSNRSQMAYAEAGKVVEQTIGSIRTVVSFTGERRAIDKYKEFLKISYRSAVHQGVAVGLGVGSLLFIVFSSYGLAVWYGAKLIIEKGYTGGYIINVLMALMTGAMALGQSSPCLTAFASGRIAAHKMFATIYRKPEIDASDRSGLILENFVGNVELKDVHFSYPARPEQMIFNGFSISIPTGKTVALVGESGSGKSTVISLLERFYDPQSGEVLLDGVNLKQLNLSWIRQKMGLVSQEPILFTTTIRENIEYGKKGASEEEIRRATVLANAAKFIDKLPNGLDTMVGEHGTQLSGGQKQRIAIARAILKNPSILLLDEATSALDAESERVVQDALNNIMVNRTTIVVAHRLSTVKNADMISVLHRGQLVEQGPHAELIKDSSGAYSQLLQLQEVNMKSKGDDPNRLQSASDTANSLSLHSSTKASFERSMSRTSPQGRSRMNSQTISLDEHETKEIDDPKSGKNVLTRLLCLHKPETPILLLGCTAAAANGSILPVFGMLLSSAINTFYEPPEKLRKDSVFWAEMYVTLGVISILVIPLQYSLFNMAGGKLIERIRAVSFGRIVYQEIGWFDDPLNSSGAIGSRLSGDAASIKTIAGDVLSLIVQSISTAVVGIIIAMIANWKLAFIVLCFLPCVIAQSYAQTKLMRGFGADSKEVYEQASTIASDAIGNIRTVASFCAEENIIKSYRKKCEAPVKKGVRQGAISGVGYGFSFALLFCFYALSFYVGARFVHNGTAEVGQVFKVFFALTMMAVGVSQSSSLARDFSKVQDAAVSIFRIIDRKSKIDASSEVGTTLGMVQGNIELQHVSFKYPARTDVQIFTDLCLRIPSGKTVALVGESGSGKSTVIALLERFYDPDSGAIFLDGVNLQTLKLSWLRQQIGLVGQEPVLFNDTIRANIAYGNEEQVTEEEIIAVAEAANAHRFISSLPHGYDTSVGERGVQLSGGQKQRIAIARAILKNPKLLLLDEATSALDAESERVVQEALDRVTIGRTTVVVAHRLLTITAAHKISVIKNGVVAEEGRHEQLLRLPGGAYASLVALQSSSSS
ncbi:ABC transporter B family member 11 isoform X1 [Brachypodium distachyon]|uniref:ABC transporter B family member 11 isoform X1 n=1 Tax=Brachypodium distachyon TaxID=15368 RepID=UPI000D0CEC82|nr:ABC transporter B family member 11 isoform X1 [Brachypodium distachyon]|eukprot:XP_010234151.2 ABC transporter B family member 11 isoform X1 [Brachypodium distachyon]